MSRTLSPEQKVAVDRMAEAAVELGRAGVDYVMTAPVLNDGRQTITFTFDRGPGEQILRRFLQVMVG